MFSEYFMAGVEIGMSKEARLSNEIALILAALGGAGGAIGGGIGDGWEGALKGGIAGAGVGGLTGKAFGMGLSKMTANQLNKAYGRIGKGEKQSLVSRILEGKKRQALSGKEVDRLIFEDKLFDVYNPLIKGRGKEFNQEFAARSVADALGGKTGIRPGSTPAKALAIAGLGSVAAGGGLAGYGASQAGR